MEVMFAEHELHNACQVLFGTELTISRGFLDYLQLSGIKSAYRKKALETHPDRASGLDHNNADSNADLFMAVQQAYENLTDFINARTNGDILINSKPAQNVTAAKPTRRPSKPRTRRSHRQYNSTTGFNRNNFQQRWSSNTHTKKSSGDPIFRATKLYKGPIPERKLLFGHYLYYSGVTNWQTITRALVWQRTERPKIGELGCRLGWLTSADILNVLKTRSHPDPFGKSAVELGLLTDHQLNLLILQQKRLQKKFGEYFIANNILTQNQLNNLIRQSRMHNYSVQNSKF